MSLLESAVKANFVDTKNHLTRLQNLGPDALKRSASPQLFIFLFGGLLWVVRCAVPALPSDGEVKPPMSQLGRPCRRALRSRDSAPTAQLPQCEQRVRSQDGGAIVATRKSLIN